MRGGVGEACGRNESRGRIVAEDFCGSAQDWELLMSEREVQTAAMGLSRWRQFLLNEVKAL